MARVPKANPESGVRLLDLWSPPPEAGDPIGCVATTFTFDAAHFEEQCLARFLMMESDPAESPRHYLFEREEKLSETFVCVLADQRTVTAQRSLRWHLLGVRLPGSGIQHAKLSLLLWERHLRILIGSANLTDPGYRSNLEIVVPLEFSPSGGAPKELARQCLEFLTQLSAFTPGNVEEAGPRRALSQFLMRARQRINSWTESEKSSGIHCQLIPLLPTRRSETVTEQVRRLWRGASPTNALIVSPFFDRSDDGIDRVYAALASLLTKRGERVINFVSSGRETPAGPVQIDIPARLVESPLRHSSTSHGVGYVPERQKIGDDEMLRDLHTKSIVLKRENNAVVLFGSSNFTVAGLGLIPSHNAELNVVYRVPPAEAQFFRQCEGALPPVQWLDDDDKRELVQWSDSSDEMSLNVAVLPRGFLEALYRPDVDSGVVELRLEPENVPQEFAIFLPARIPLIESNLWRAAFGSAATVTLPLSEIASALTVEWRNNEGERLSAIWPINVSDVSLLIPPKELRNLTLEDLMLVLISARPPFQILAERAEMKDRAGPSCPVVDPHKKVDTSQFLLRRMRRLAKALEGLRVRLERPISSAEGWTYRLHGPLGPVALARALNAESGQEAPFFVSEVAATVRAVRWTVGTGITSAVIQQELDAALSVLRDLSLKHVNEMPANLSAYVQDIFRGIAL